MALQVNSGTVQVTNASQTVRHEWKLLMTSVTGPGTFAVNSTVTWTGGAGTVGSWDSVGKVLLVARTSGVNPAVGLVISQASPSVAGATVSSIAPGSPPNWNAKVTLPAVATFQRHYGDYSVASLAADSFVLQPATGYLGASARDVEYGLNTDFTSLGLGLIRPGDVGATNIITRSMVRLNTLLTRGVAALRLTANLTMTNGMTISWQFVEEDTGGFTSAVPTTTFVVPAGIKRVDVGCNVKLTAALSTGAQFVEARLLKNTTEIATNSMGSPRSALQTVRGGVPVSAGDTFSVKIYVAGSSLPSILADTLTNFGIRVAEVV